MKKLNSMLAAAAIMAATMAPAESAQPPRAQRRRRPEVRPEPRRTTANNGRYIHAMVTAPDHEIATWNSSVTTRQVLRHNARHG